MLFRNMDMNEVLSESISFFVRNWRLIAGTVVLACLPYFLWQLLWIQQPSEWTPAQIYRSSRDLLTVAGLVNVIFVDGVVNGQLIAGLLLAGYVSLVRGGALAHALSQRYLGRKVTPAQAVGRANSRLWPLFVGHGWVLLIIALLAVLVPKLPVSEIELLVFAIVMMAVMPRLLLITQTIMIEEVAGVEGIRRSLMLVSGRFWYIFAIWVVVEIVLALLTLVPVFALGLAQSTLSGRSELYASAIISTLAMLFIDPIFDVVLVFLYYQLRRRKEHFSIPDL